MNPLNLKATPVVPHLSELGEGPVWDEQRESIHWLDIERGHIHSYNSYRGDFATLEVQQRIGFITLCKDQHAWRAGLQNGLAEIDRNNGAVRIISDPESHLPENRFNDGKCDPQGRLWAGTMSTKEEPGAGNLYMLDVNGRLIKKKEGVTISNGMAWSADKKIFYYIDTPTRAVTAWDFDNETGHISHERIILMIPENEGFPDGMTIDTEGMLWVAHWGGWQVSRWDPFSGKKIASIALPVKRVTSCTFGGRHLEDLYITTARKDMDPEEKETQRLAGSLFVVKNCGYRGLPATRFAG